MTRSKRRVEPVADPLVASRWSTSAYHRQTWLHVDGRRLSIVVQWERRPFYLAIAVEAAAGAATFRDVLDEHAHHLIGDRFRTARGAFRKSEAFARRWLRTRSMKAACACPRRSA